MLCVTRLLLGVVILGAGLPALGQPALLAQQRATPDSGKFLAPGDRVKLAIWREPDLSGEFEVDEAGLVMLPKLGPTRVTSLTPDALQSDLVARYGAYLRNPSIGVTVLHRVSVEGAVRNPGIYSVAPTMTLVDVVALAGGATSEGKADRFELMRDGTAYEVVRGTGTRVENTPVRSGDQIVVPLKSWMSRNPAVVAGTMTALAGIIVTLMVR